MNQRVDASNQLRRWLFEFHNCVNRQCQKQVFSTFETWNRTFPAIPTAFHRQEFHRALLRMLYAFVWTYPEAATEPTSKQMHDSADRPIEERRQLFMHCLFLLPFIVPRLLRWIEFWQIYERSFSPNVLRLAYVPPIRNNAYFAALCELHYELRRRDGATEEEDQEQEEVPTFEAFCAQQTESMQSFEA